MQDHASRDLSCGTEFPRQAVVAIALPLLLAACTNIWNASDLAVWVGDRAVEQGCQRDTIELDEWYKAERQGNVWHGTCQDAAGNQQSFGIHIDRVWKPSTPAT